MYVLCSFSQSNLANINLILVIGLKLSLPSWLLLYQHLSPLPKCYLQVVRFALIRLPHGILQFQILRGFCLQMGEGLLLERGTALRESQAL